MNKEEARKFKFEKPYIFLHKRSIFYRNEKARFSKIPDETAVDVITNEHYTNYITSIPFFNSWGDGAYCRAYEAHTVAGYIPDEMNTVSPHRLTKHNDTFFPLPYPSIYECGFREREVLEHLRSAELIQNDNEHLVIRFYHSDNEHTFEYDYKMQKIVG